MKLKSGFTEFTHGRMGMYPYLGRSREFDFIVLFKEPRTGTVVLATNQAQWKLGEYSTEWVESNFDPVCGSVTLTQD